jgi:hypothetical protein
MTALTTSLREAEFAEGERSDEAIPHNGTASPIAEIRTFSARPKVSGTRNFGGLLRRSVRYREPRSLQ